MTRTQIQQLVVVLLLILFAAVFLLNKNTPEIGVPVTGPGTAVIASEQQPVEPAVPPPAPVDLSISRDVFLLPPLLVQRLKERQDQLALEQERQKQLKQQGLVRPPSLIEPQAGAPPLVLQGIFWGIAKPQAIINRKIVSVGDKIDDAEVESITKDSVTLSMDGTTVELKPENLRSSKK